MLCAFPAQPTPQLRPVNKKSHLFFSFFILFSLTLSWSSSRRRVSRLDSSTSSCKMMSPTVVSGTRTHARLESTSTKWPASGRGRRATSRAPGKRGRIAESTPSSAISISGGRTRPTGIRATSPGRAPPAGTKRFSANGRARLGTTVGANTRPSRRMMCSEPSEMRMAGATWSPANTLERSSRVLSVLWSGAANTAFRTHSACLTWRLRDAASSSSTAASISRRSPVSSSKPPDPSRGRLRKLASNACFSKVLFTQSTSLATGEASFSRYMGTLTELE
mmetsp:Transcript_5628/g.19086  ORF Transcript_5628/g.19086 Transcript_5628/m.19086 type:complete len:278 (+) Transcript_5628:810-1643(+)